MAIVAVTFKVMPVSTEINLEELKGDIEKSIKKIGGTLHKAEEEPIAFGLKALIFIIGWPEEKNPEMIETTVGKIKGVSSIEITDVRRAIG